jgi:restriction system protein
MAAPKRRKPGDRTARLESQAAVAWARENAWITAREATDKASGTKKAAEERGVAAGHAEAEAITQSLQARLTELETLLASTLGGDPYLPFQRLKEPAPQARFQPPPELAEPARAPELDAPVPPSGFGALAPGRKHAYAEAVARYQADYEQVMAAHARGEQQRSEQLARARASDERSRAADRERVRRQHAAIDQMAIDFAAGQRTAVADVKTHVTRILTKLDLRDRVQVVVLAYEAGVIVPGLSDQA